MKARKFAGYILLEVMVALTILAAGIVTVTQAFRSGLREERRSEQQYRAAIELEARLLAAEKTLRPDLSPARSEALGNFNFDETETTDLSGGGRRRMALHWGEPGNVQSIELSTTAAE